MLGDFALNCAWDDHGAIPTMVDLFRWHGSEEVEHRMVAHDVAVYFHDSYVDRIRAMAMAVAMIFVFFQRAAWYLVKTDPNTDIGWWKIQAAADARLEARPASQVPQAVWLQHADVLQARFLAGGDGFDGAGGRIPGQLPRGPRRASLMGLLDRYRQAPPSASGRMRHDVTLGLADVALTGLWALSGAIRRMSAPPENDRTIALTVADRRVVAHDQDVIALTLVGEQLPRWHPGAHIDIHLPSGLVRQYSLCGDPAITGHLPHRRASDPGWRRRLHRNARLEASARR